MKIPLIVREDPTTGESALFHQSMNMTDSMFGDNEGIVIAHDFVEHVNGLDSIGSFEDELEACAGVWLTRGQHNDISRSGSSRVTPYENIAADISVMFEQWCHSPRPLVYKDTKRHDEDESFDIILDYARASGYEANPGKWPEWAKACKHLMRSGANKFNKRWDRTKKDPNTVFWNIVRCVQEITSDHELYPGMEFVLKLSDRDCVYEELIEDY